ncbi:hypothetical protein ACA910_022223 [Epithemia clementina (nom. ined.)]
MNPASVLDRKSRSRRRWLVVVLVGGFVIWIVGLLLLKTGTTHSTNATTAIQKGHSNDDKKYTLQRRRRTSSSSSLETSQLVQNFQVARAKFMAKLDQDYGSENVQLLFKTVINGTTHSMARKVFQATPLSWDRLKRKVVMKILKAQQMAQQAATEQKQVPFVWATGGHSASAGHGNLFHESYTAIFQAGGAAIFDAVGLELTTRNHAMGGASCGMEIASCIKEVFGMDTDVLSWDYGMTTFNPGKVELYFHRASLLPNRPAFVGIVMTHDQEALQSMESLGPAVFLMQAEDVVRAVPDTQGKTLEEINAMPPYIRSFRCGKGIEKGEPTCLDEKYTILPDNDPCNERLGRVSWHPGWKWHALYGNLLTLFWIEIIDDALREIAQQGSDPRALLLSLQTLEDEEFLPMMSKNVSNLRFVDDHLNAIPDIANEVVYWSPNFCHTARVPSEIRYQGLLTESQLKGGYHNYDHGLELSQVLTKANDQMPLSWDPDLYQLFCKNYEIVIDHEDFFVVNSLGWSSLLLPNPLEKAYYGDALGSQPLLGYIAICLAQCGWECPAGVLSYDDLWNGTKASMTVNGVAVANYTNYGPPASSACIFLQQESGGHQWAPNSNGLFEVRAKATNSGDYLRISSIVIW